MPKPYSDMEQRWCGKREAVGTNTIWPSVLVIAPSQELLLKSTNRNLSVAVLGECFGWIEIRTWQDRDLFGW